MWVETKYQEVFVVKFAQAFTFENKMWVRPKIKFKPAAIIYEHYTVGLQKTFKNLAN